jgi:hypothetical protein
MLKRYFTPEAFGMQAQNLALEIFLTIPDNQPS